MFVNKKKTIAKKNVYMFHSSLQVGAGKRSSQTNSRLARYVYSKKTKRTNKHITRKINVQLAISHQPGVRRGTRRASAEWTEKTNFPMVQMYQTNSTRSKRKTQKPLCVATLCIIPSLKWSSGMEMTKQKKRAVLRALKTLGAVLHTVPR